MCATTATITATFPIAATTAISTTISNLTTSKTEDIKIRISGNGEVKIELNQNILYAYWW